MSAYGVVICKKAEKQIKKLSKDDAKNVIFALTGLGDDPRPKILANSCRGLSYNLRDRER